MGSIYTNHTLRGASPPEVLAFMQARKAAAFVSTGLKGCTVLLDSDSDWQIGESELARDLSRRFACAVLTVTVHHDDALNYELWHAGERRDTYYVSTEEEDIPEDGDAEALTRLMGEEGCDAAAVERVLRAPSGDEPGGYLLEHERHQALAAALGLPPDAAGFGYRYLQASMAAGAPLSTAFESTDVPDDPDQVNPRPGP